MHACMHTYMHTYIHTYIHAYAHIHLQLGIVLMNQTRLPGSRDNDNNNSVIPLMIIITIAI